ncbi:MAG: UDP-N-acetylmuramoyl-L-alanyl-D-glutamate--2,6-diaminopimelate ligase [Anaerolineales bacterium]|uniref:UDP-N-acetylmuramoyl-L-alanyl-D-glutamate--2, 6-diaminopimelate ligase n=1 Tax=Candidatus Villigracilis vicinus TaxID=3140679 RepID=UPI003135AB8A|nr:UDP-N-acetylmuramoyl-L-alanyl-D-glutamate--2,6-diaminopimelate ligase [Anaerolineales bacterium]MBK9780742.1 UDP-N-acetylmuramoyl-L-alanyl-D-glutamate--2,6-diaminopimelate ligase [Anaerolineales bacterium]
MLLKNLFIDFPFSYPPSIPDVEISGITIDSRTVKPGDLFVAMRGRDADGHNYISKAIDNGAVAVIGDKDISGIVAPYVQLEDARHSLTWLAAAFHGFPARKLTVIGVTGTDGKTTTSNLLYKILIAAGLKAGMISTVNAVIGNEVLDTGFHVTTPDAHDVQRYLARMVEAGLTHVVLETTSHGWSQHRVDACEFDIAAVTNITHEHMDEHGGYENYRAAKARLFSSLEWTQVKPTGNPRLGVINFDDKKSYNFLTGFIKTNKVSYGLEEGADVRGMNVDYSPEGIRFTAVAKDFRVAIKSDLVGAYNVSNCLAALTVAVRGLGIDPQVAAQGIAALAGIPGRMERIDMGQNFTAIVDFAHTPNALKVALEAGRTMTNKRVIAVFGSAGLRDKEKRRMMAETSAELADLTVLTAEDPRVESLDGILEEMAEGMRAKGGREGENFWRVPDRGEAIKFALRLAEEGDIVLSCGKGHEQSMCFGKTEFLWDDRTAMRAALAEFLGVDGPVMPYLPSQDKNEAEWLKG